MRARRYIKPNTKFGRWTLLKQLHCDTSLCRCDCGAEKFVSEKRLLGGTSKSCGCLRRDLLIASGTGMRDEREIWYGIMKRCYNPKSKSFIRYGERGIKVCRRWHKVDNFLADMGKRPSFKHSIERKNNNGHYSPSNCIWASSITQNKNKRSSLRIRYRGRTMILKDWCKEIGISYSTGHGRFKRGFTTKDILYVGSLKKRNASCPV